MYSKEILIKNYEYFLETTKKFSSKNFTTLAVTKSKPFEAILDSLDLGINNIAESYVQEFLEKKELIKDENINWHFIGRLQTNKIKFLADKVSYIHSVDNEKQILEISKRFTKKVNLFFEVNTGEEASKGGSKNIFSLCEFFFKLKETNENLILIGLMTIPPFSTDAEASRPFFKKLRNLKENLNKEFGLKLENLSMGMSSDYLVALEEGATHIRIGTLLYGKR